LVLSLREIDFFSIIFFNIHQGFSSFILRSELLNNFINIFYTSCFINRVKIFFIFFEVILSLLLARSIWILIELLVYILSFTSLIILFFLFKFFLVLLIFLFHCFYQFFFLTYSLFLLLDIVLSEFSNSSFFIFILSQFSYSQLFSMSSIMIKKSKFFIIVLFSFKTLLNSSELFIISYSFFFKSFYNLFVSLSNTLSFIILNHHLIETIF